MPSAAGNSQGFGWFAIMRIGMVQASIGAMVMFTTTVLNRLMIIEYSMLAAIPAGLVGWHYAVQLCRPIWGHGSDKGGMRGLWIVGGLIVLAIGSLLAVQFTIWSGPMALQIVLGIAAYTLIGIGVGAGGTCALALLASGVAPKRRAAAAAVTWIMMIAGIVASAATVSQLLDPYSPERLIWLSTNLFAVCLAVTALAVFRLEPRETFTFAETHKAGPPPGFKAAIAEVFAEPAARRFTIFIFVSMMAFNMQDLILEPFAGLVFGMTPGESTGLGGLQSGGVLAGMIVAGIGGSAFSGRLPVELRHWITFGCAGSALALVSLAIGAVAGPGWPIHANVFVLGFCNGLFAVAAIGAMMGLAGAGAKTREGVRMGVWGASQAIAFGLGGLLGALGLDIARKVLAHDGGAFQIIFAIEASLFVIAAILAMRATGENTANEGANQGAQQDKRIAMTNGEGKIEAEVFA